MNGLVGGLVCSERCHFGVVRKIYRFFMFFFLGGEPSKFKGFFFFFKAAK